MRYPVSIIMDVANDGSIWFVQLNEGKDGICLVFRDGKDHPKAHVEGSMHLQIGHVALRLQPCEFRWYWHRGFDMPPKFIMQARKVGQTAACNVGNSVDCMNRTLNRFQMVEQSDNRRAVDFGWNEENVC